jgi:hypothetical protein
VSLHFAVWHSEKAISDQEAADLYLKLYEQRRTPIEQHIDVYSFYNELAARCPEVDMVPEEQLENCPWACAHDRSGFHVIMSVLDEKADEAVPLIRELAEKHGLVYFDAQSNTVQLPSNLQTVAVHKGGTLHIVCMNEGQQPPEYQVAFSNNGALGRTIKMLQIHGDSELAGFLAGDVGVDPAQVGSAVESLKSEGKARILDVALSDADLIVLGLR